MSKLIITVDLDWACEPAIEELLDFLEDQNIKPTIFITHKSARVEESFSKFEVGLHPYFAPESSHGSTIDEVVKHVMDLPHNLPAFRCHRFAICNTSKQALLDAGMSISSNVCTDLEVVPAFKDRFGFLEIPIFLEDGGYLWQKHPLDLTVNLENLILNQGVKVILIHPMHFALNTPHFSYMLEIKKSVSREEWINMSKATLNKLRWRGRGIRDLLVDIIKIAPQIISLGSFYIPRVRLA